MVSPEVENVIDFSIIAVIHVGAAFAPFYFTSSAFVAFLLLHFVTGCLGITTTYHRLLTHRRACLLLTGSYSQPTRCLAARFLVRTDMS
jgi:fatty-acid desaturase